MSLTLYISARLDTESGAKVSIMPSDLDAFVHATPETDVAVMREDGNHEDYESLWTTVKKSRLCCMKLEVA